MRVTANVLCEISVNKVHFNDKIKHKFASVAVTWLEIRRLAVANVTVRSLWCGLFRLPLPNRGKAL